MEPAWAKLNLSLDVLGARADGFHDLRMVMQSVDLHDDVTVTLDDTGTCRAETNRSYLPCGADNVAVRAAQVFLARAGLTCGVHIRLHKRIPVCAGLGGGSSDAAAVLRALERLTGAGFTRTQLEEMGAEIGSDVPYCVAGGTVLAEGRGERLTPVAHAASAGRDLQAGFSDLDTGAVPPRGRAHLALPSGHGGHLRRARGRGYAPARPPDVQRL